MPIPDGSNDVSAYETAAQSYHDHLANPALSPLHGYYEKPAMHNLLPELGGLAIACLGCGSGEDAKWLQDAGAVNISAVDLSENLITIAQTKFSDIDFRVMDMSELDFPSESFDIAYSSLAMHYIKNWEKPLAEVHRVLRDGGRFIFSCTHPLESALHYAESDQQRTAMFGRVISEATEARTIIGDYMSLEQNGVREIDRTFADEHAVTYYHRTFGVMMNGILAAGFKVRGIVEPQPDQQMQETNPEHYKQVLKQPKFLIWDLEK